MLILFAPNTLLKLSKKDTVSFDSVQRETMTGSNKGVNCVCVNGRFFCGVGGRAKPKRKQRAVHALIFYFFLSFFSKSACGR